MPSGSPSQQIEILNLAILGYGKMGKMVEKLAKERGHAIQTIIPSKQSPMHITECDMVIDFTAADSTIDNVHHVGKAGKNLVIGTTGWQHQIDAVRKLADHYQIGILFSPNFSIGMHLFLRLVSEACQLLSPLGIYDIAGSETHHRQKLDAPSGTARAIAQKVLEHWQGKTEVDFDLPETALPKNTFHFSTTRLGYTNGIHSITCDSPHDTISLTHTAKSREAFALGSILAAEWLKGKKGFYTMEDML